MEKVIEKNQRLSDAERIKLVRDQKNRKKHTLQLLSVIGVLGFFLLWQLAVVCGWVSSKYLTSPIEIFSLFITKLTDPAPEGAVLGVNILASLQVSLTGFLLAIGIGVPLGLVMGWYKGTDAFALGNAWATLVAAEMLASSAGLGYMILMGRQFARPDIIILGIFVIGIIGTLFTFLLGKVENKVLGWKKL